MSKKIVKIPMSIHQLKELAKFCKNKGMDLESISYELLATDRVAEGGRADDKAQRWYQLQKEFERHLPKRKLKNDI